MLCEKCKIREASVQIVEIVNGVKSEHHYCTQCASELDLAVSGPGINGQMPLAKLLSTLLSQTVKSHEVKEYANVVCPTCKTTYEQFIKDSKFGCADCYKVFDLLIGENIKQLQGSNEHKGKKPKFMSGEIPTSVKEDINESLNADIPSSERLDKLIKLRKKLRQAVATEEYENAAKIRDEIKNLEKEGTSHDE